MNGTDLLNEISRRLKKRGGVDKITDTALAEEIGIAQPNLAVWRARKRLTVRQVVNLMYKAEKRAQSRTIAQAINPIIEFLNIDPVESKQGSKSELFSASEDGRSGEHPYLAGIKEKLSTSHGLYIFHDSRGRAIYAGKAVSLTLWTEMKSAFNRDRGDVQSIKRVGHPSSWKAYSKVKDGKRPIKRLPVALHQIASYVSAYEVSTDLISKLEALIVRAFANDLLNVRMEKFERD
jgi:hypothetical protein